MARSPDVVVVLGGEDRDVAPLVPFTRAGTVIAADAGAHRADALGLPVHHLVGDMDSISPERLALAERSTTTIHRHPSDKDATDGELAVLLAGELVRPHGAEEGRPWLAVVGSPSGRLDLLLADLFLLAGPATEPFEVTTHLGDVTAVVVRPGRPVEVDGPVGSIVSLLPVHGDAGGVSAAGVRWPLDGATLPAATTLGLSNELTAGSASFGVDTGVVLVVAPAAATVRFVTSTARRAHLGRWTSSPS